MKKTLWILLVLVEILFITVFLRAQGPVAAYSFNETSGATTSDSSGNGNTLTFINSPARVAGKYGNGVQFAGTNQYLQAPNFNSLNVAGSAITISLWVNVTDRSYPDHVIFGKMWNAVGFASPYYQYGLEFSSSRKTADFYFGGTDNSQDGPYSMSIPTAAWVHVSFTFNGARVVGYKNGTQAYSANVTKQIAARGNKFLVGVDGNIAQPFKGIIDEIRIYNRVLTQAEIQADMNTPIGGTVPPPTDTTPPLLSSGSPTGTLVAGTTQTVLSLVTNENAACRYATNAGIAYTSMTGAFNTSNGLTHATTLTGLTNGSTYNRFVRCIDTSGNTNTIDYPISFSVAILPPPVPGIVSYDVHPDAPVVLIWDYDPAFQSQINGFGLYAGQTSTGPWTFYNGIPDPIKRTFTFVAPDRTTYFTLNACKQTSSTAGECSVMSNIIKLNCIPLSEQFLWQSFVTRPCQ